MTRYFEDFPEGLTLEYGAYEVTREEIIHFAQQFDPQPFHLDEEAGRQSLLGGLAASGWHSASISMRLHCDHWLNETRAVGSPGIPELKWMKPVRPGDILRIRARVESARLSKSRPGLGLVEWSYLLLNQKDDELMKNRGFLMTATRDSAAVLPAGALARKTAQPAATTPVAHIHDPATLPDDHGLLTSFFEDVRIGETVDAGATTFSKMDIITFATAYDPQFIHINEATAQAGPYGALIASGWHTASACMRRLVDTRNLYTQEALRRGLRTGAKGPSPGFSNLRWLKPVFAGDTLNFSMTPADKRRTSRKDWGIVFTHFSGVNQLGEKVYEYQSASFWPLKNA